jgi:hypothetical protein
LVDHPLHHVEIAHDASTPVIGADVHVGSNPMKNILEEIKKPEST